MSRPLLLDTDVLIDFLHGQQNAVSVVSGNADRNVKHYPMLKDLEPAYRK